MRGNRIKSLQGSRRYKGKCFSITLNNPEARPTPPKQNAWVTRLHYADGSYDVFRREVTLHACTKTYWGTTFSDIHIPNTLFLSSMTDQQLFSNEQQRIVHSGLDRDQGDAIVLGILQADKYPFMTSWAGPDRQKDALKAALIEHVKDKGFREMLSPISLVYEREDVILSLDLPSGRLFCFSNDFATNQAIATIFYPFFARKDADETEGLRLTSFTLRKDGQLQQNSKVIKPEHFELFNPKFYDIPLDWVDDYVADTNAENILILSGPPGTGKTYLARYLAMKLKGGIATTNDSACLQSEAFWDHLDEEDFGALVLDDVDDDLQNREGNKFVRNMLTFANGLRKSSTRIVLTTNKKVDTLDEALVRSGRCFDVFHISALSRDVALTIWTDVYKKTTEEFEFFFSEIEHPSAADVISCKDRSLLKNKRKRHFQGNKDTFERTQKYGL